MKENEEDVLYDVKSLFTNIRVKETIGYMIDQSEHICAKLIFKGFLSILLNANFLFQVAFTNKLMDIHWVTPSLLLLVMPVC